MHGENRTGVGYQTYEVVGVICGHCFRSTPSGYNTQTPFILTGMVNAILKERRPTGRLSFNTVLPVWVRQDGTTFYIDTGPQWYVV